MLSIKLKANAHQNPFTLNPGTNASTSKMISALITSRNKPSVAIVRGIVNKISTGLTITFAIDNTSAARRA